MQIEEVTLTLTLHYQLYPDPDPNPNPNGRLPALGFGGRGTSLDSTPTGSYQ